MSTQIQNVMLDWADFNELFDMDPPMRRGMTTTYSPLKATGVVRYFGLEIAYESLKDFEREFTVEEGANVWYVKSNYANELVHSAGCILHDGETTSLARIELTLRSDNKYHIVAIHSRDVMQLSTLFAALNRLKMQAAAA